LTAVRILVIAHVHLAGRGGAENVTSALISQFRAAGHDVSTITYDDLPPVTPQRLRRVLLPYFVVWRLIGRGQQREFDVIDANTGDVWLYASIARRRPLLVVRSHGLEPLGEAAYRRHAASVGRRPSLLRDLYYRHWMLWEVRRSLRLADVIRTLNAAESDYCTERLRIPPGRVLMRSNGRMPASPPRASPASGSAIAAIGRWEPLKGSTDLVAAMTTVLRGSAEARLTLLGTQLGDAAVRSCFPLDVRSRIDVVPDYDPGDVEQLLSGHDIYVSMSHVEGFSLALIEAMAQGLTPVVTDVGAAPMLVDPSCGRVVPRGAVDGCVEAVLDLLRDAPLRRKLQRAARAAVADLTWDLVADRDLHDYSRGLAARQRV
jgi:glycosyltransferase involved in cell wall biosynthesis